MAIHQLGEVVLCPHCNKPQDGVVEDFVVSNKLGHSFEDECFDCGGKFNVTQINNKEFNVEKV